MRKYLQSYSELRTDNLRHMLRPILLRCLERYKDYAETEGIVILGGAAENAQRPFLDHNSDLDGSIFVSLPCVDSLPQISLRQFLENHQECLPPWLPPFESQIPLEQHPQREVDLNIHQQILEFEEREGAMWDEGRCAAYANCEILFDRTGRVGRLIRQRVRWRDEISYRLLLRNLGQAQWYGIINPEKQIERGMMYSAHDLINEATELLIHAVYLINREYRPHKKWRLQHAYSLRARPTEFRERIIALMQIEDCSEASVRRRIMLISALLDDVIEIAESQVGVPEDVYRASCVFSFEDRQLKRGLISKANLARVTTTRPA